MTDDKRGKILEVTQKFASEGLRVLAFAYRKLESNYMLENAE
jgi:magnesium-transporting ATPase (P-type)